MMKRLALLALAVISCLGLTAKETIRIGAILPLSGNQARFGESAQKAISMQLEKLNANPDHKFHYEVIFEDDQMQGRLALQALQKLRTLDGISAVLTFSAPGGVVAPICQQAGIVQIGCGAAPSIYKGSMNFDHWVTLDPPSRMMAQTLQKLKYKRVAIATQRHQSTLAHTKTFKKLAPEYGLEIVFDQQMNSDEKDLRTMMLKLKQSKPDIVLLNAVNPVGDIFLRQMQEMGLGKMSVSAITCLYALERPSLKNIWWVDPSTAQPWFYKAFRERYGHTPEVVSANHYDSLALIAQACEQWESDGIPDGEFIAERLMEVKDYTGAIGPTTPTPEGVFDVPSQLVTVTDDFNAYRVLSFDEVKAIEDAKLNLRQFE